MGAVITKFTPERVSRILNDIKDCIPYKIAAESNGIANATLYDWIDNGIRDFNAGIESDYTKLVEALREIEKSKINKLLRNIENEKKGHKGAEWMLQTVFWKHFSSNAATIDLNERLEKLESGAK